MTTKPIVDPIQYLQANHKDTLEIARNNAKLSYFMEYFKKETDIKLRTMTNRPLSSDEIDNLVRNFNFTHEHPDDFLYKSIEKTEGIRNDSMREDTQDMAYSLYLRYLKLYNLDIEKFNLPYEKAIPKHETIGK